MKKQKSKSSIILLIRGFIKLLPLVFYDLARLYFDILVRSQNLTCFYKIIVTNYSIRKPHNLAPNSCTDIEEFQLDNGQDIRIYSITSFTLLRIRLFLPYRRINIFLLS